MKISLFSFIISLICSSFFITVGCNNATSADNVKGDTTITKTTGGQAGLQEKLDTADYDIKLKALANGDTTGRWPAKFPYPLPGAILPFNRIVAFYGNLYSKKMGILGELPKDEMLAKLKGEVAKWQAADSSLPVIPALHYIAVTAQGSPGKDGKHSFRMPLKSNRYYM